MEGAYFLRYSPCANDGCFVKNCRMNLWTQKIRYVGKFLAIVGNTATYCAVWTCELYSIVELEVFSLWFVHFVSFCSIICAIPTARGVTRATEFRPPPSIENTLHSTLPSSSVRPLSDGRNDRQTGQFVFAADRDWVRRIFFVHLKF